jgi:Anti-sigma factor NepR
MILPENSTPFPAPDAGQRIAPQSLKTYDTLAGAALLRRTGRSFGAPLRGDTNATLLSARRGAEAEDRIGRQLKDFYQSLLQEPVPDRFVALLDSLEAQDAR